MNFYYNKLENKSIVYTNCALNEYLSDHKELCSSKIGEYSPEANILKCISKCPDGYIPFNLLIQSDIEYYKEKYINENFTENTYNSCIQCFNNIVKVNGKEYCVKCKENEYFNYLDLKCEKCLIAEYSLPLYTPISVYDSSDSIVNQSTISSLSCKIINTCSLFDYFPGIYTSSNLTYENLNLNCMKRVSITKLSKNPDKKCKEFENNISSITQNDKQFFNESAINTLLDTGLTLRCRRRGCDKGFIEQYDSYSNSLKTCNVCSDGK